MAVPAAAPALSLVSRIVRKGPVSPASLRPHPMNLRRHPPRQEQLMLAVLLTAGEVAPVLVSENTGLLLDGHLRHKLALKHGIPKLQAVWVDVSPDEELLILASYDAVAMLADVDADAQAAAAEAALALAHEPTLLDFLRGFGPHTDYDTSGLFVDHTASLTSGAPEPASASVIKQIVFQMDTARYQRLVPALLRVIQEHDLADTYEAVVFLLDREEGRGNA